MKKLFNKPEGKLRYAVIPLNIVNIMFGFILAHDKETLDYILKESKNWEVIQK